MDDLDYKRVTLTFDLETKVSDEEAIDEVIDKVTVGDVMNWFVQTLPDLGPGRWVER